MLSRQPSSRPDVRARSALEPRIPLLYWLIVGGTGPPPTKVNFRRMVSERNAVYREEKAYQKARKAASAEFKAKWPKKRQRLGRQESIGLYESGGTVQRQTQGEGMNDGGGNGDDSRNVNDIDGNNGDIDGNNGDNSRNNGDNNAS